MFSQSRNIATLNAWHYDTARDSRSRRMGEEFAIKKPDVLLLQEVPYDNHEGDSKFLDNISRISGLKVAHRQVFVEIDANKGSGYLSGLAILSNLPLIEAGTALHPKNEDQGLHNQGVYAVFEDGEKAFAVINVHGVWGGHLAHKRETQFKMLDMHASMLEQKYADRELFVVMGGDFNTEPESSVIRYLKGLQGLGDEGAYWIDAWAFCGEGEGSTSSSKMKFFHETASNRGVKHPQFTPDRRIDYLMVKGWQYGKRGTPLSIELCATEEDENGYTVSDHFGLMSKIWCP